MCILSNLISNTSENIQYECEVSDFDGSVAVAEFVQMRAALRQSKALLTCNKLRCRTSSKVAFSVLRPYLRSL